MSDDVTVDQEQVDSRPFNKPLHLDVAVRNERLYETLLKMGLYVTPLLDKANGIDCFIVSTGVPAYVPDQNNNTVKKVASGTSLWRVLQGVPVSSDL